MTTENEQESTETETPQTENLSQPSETEDSAFEDVNFSELTDLVEGVEPPSAEPAEETTEEVETPPEETPAEETVETESTAETETSEEQEQAATAETPAEEVEVEQPPEVKVPTKEELEGMYEDHRKQMLPQLEQTFQLTEEEAAALDEAPSKMLPKLAARMAYEVLLSSYNANVAAMPSIVNRLISVSQTAQKAEGNFYTRWPDLKDGKHAAAVKTAVQAYRSANPRATANEVIEKAGLMAMIQVGLDPTKVGKTESAPASKPAVKPPAKPAAPRGTTQTAPPPAKDRESSGNLFGDLAEAFNQEHR